ncbi:MAG: hypothetical protein WDZ59_00215 [Pirellulales bacterium]
MTPRQSAIPSTAAAVQLEGVRRQKTLRPLYQCLVVSWGDGRRGSIVRAARDASWAPIVCRDAISAAEHCARSRVYLALVDLLDIDQAAREHTYRLCERLVETQQPLLVICGHENQPHEEIWARQLGAWLYLPGLVETKEMTALAEEARLVVDKQYVIHAPPETELSESAACSANRRETIWPEVAPSSRGRQSVLRARE